MCSVREITPNDYYKGYMKLINIFTKNPLHVSYEEFDNCLKKISHQNSIILVAEIDNVIVGTLKILKEYKLHNNLSLMAHIEDVVVHNDFRHMKIATGLLEKALEYTKDCYKTVLSCKPELQHLYTKLGFCQTGIAFTLYNSISDSSIPSK